MTVADETGAAETTEAAVEAPQETASRPRDESGKFAKKDATDDHEAAYRAAYEKTLPKTEETASGVVEDPVEEEETTETEASDEPLSDKDRESLKRDLGLTDDDAKSLPVAVLRRMAEKSAERQRQLDDLYRQTKEQSKERPGSETESAPTKPSADEPELDAADLEPLREIVGDKAFGTLVAKLEAPQQKLAALEREREEQQQREAAEGAIRSAIEGLAGELPALKEPDAPKTLGPTMVALSQTGEYESDADLVRAAYELKYGAAERKKAETRARTERRTKGQPLAPQARPAGAKKLSYEEKMQDYHRRISSGQSTDDALRGSGLRK